MTGVFCGVLSTMNPHATNFKITMDNLNAFMGKMKFDNDFRCTSSVSAALPPPLWLPLL